MPESDSSLDRLRRHIARIEGMRPPDDASRFTTGHCSIDKWLDGGLARGRLHEILTDNAEDAASLAGFAAMLALRASDGKPLLWLRTEKAERDGGRIYATGMSELGMDACDLLVGILRDDASLLRAANDAARCGGLGMLVAETWGDPRSLDLVATRRLMLAAEASGVTVLLVRAAARDSPSVADTRWRVTPAPSTALAANAPGSPAFDLELLRRRAGPAGRSWRVEWNRERQVFQPSQQATLPGAALPLAAG